ncbi:MAG: DNA polymerase III subunit gamma/tau [Capsulimonadaceae bacterium]
MAAHAAAGAGVRASGIKAGRRPGSGAEGARARGRQRAGPHRAVVDARGALGQEHVTTTLKNAILAGRIGSGYLFTGTRGTAKTTCARILAKAVNCVGPSGERTEPSPIPCGECYPCRAIASSSFVDVLEMDAASHGKVDDVRDLVASIKFPPMAGRYKVYIIDEAHQLSRDAMDAFLKTLEEPPNRVLFILATTEIEKLPITIASRCQVFEFRRGSVSSISSRLNVVLDAEGVKADRAAIALVARAADGSYRDSLSLLEQVLAYKPSDITAPDVTRVLGTVDDDVLGQVITVIAAHDHAGAFAAADAIMSAGKDVRQFVRTLSTRLRDMLLIAVGAHAADAEVAEAARAQSSLLPTGTLLRALELLAEVERDMRWSSQHRLMLEITLLRLCTLSSEATPREERHAQQDPHMGAHARPEARHTDSRSHPFPGRLSTPTAAREAARPIPPVSPAIVEPATSVGGSRSEPVAAAPGHASAPPANLATDSDDGDDADSVDTGEGFMELQQVAAVAPAMRQEPPVDGPADLVRLLRSWQEVVNRMGTRSPAGASMVKDATPIRFENSVFTLRFTNPLFVDRLEKNDRGRKTIEEIICRTLDVEPGTFRIRCVLESAMSTEPPASRPALDSPESPTVRALTNGRENESPTLSERDSGQLMDEVIAVFGGKILDD